MVAVTLRIPCEQRLDFRGMRWRTVKPLLTPPPPEGLIYFKRFEGVLIETGEGLIWEGELIQFSKDDGISSP